MGWKLFDRLGFGKSAEADPSGREKAAPGGSDAETENHYEANALPLDQPLVILYSASAKRVFHGRMTPPVIPGGYLKKPSSTRGLRLL